MRSYRSHCGSCPTCRATPSCGCSDSRPTGPPTALPERRDDTIRMALLPSLLVLLGSMVLLGLRWSSLGIVIAVGALAYVSMTVLFSTRYIAPAARVSTACDT